MINIQYISFPYQIGFCLVLYWNQLETGLWDRLSPPAHDHVLLSIQELSVDKIKLDGVNTLAQRLIGQDHSGSTEIQESLVKLNAKYVICAYINELTFNRLNVHINNYMITNVTGFEKRCLPHTQQQDTLFTIKR